MSDNVDKIRQRLAASASCLHSFFEFIFDNPLKVGQVFDDPVLSCHAKKAHPVFNFLGDLAEEICKDDDHASTQIDKLMLEFSCLTEWAVRLLLHICSHITPYTENETVRLFIDQIGKFFNRLSESKRELFDYLMKEFEDLVSKLCLFYDQNRIGHKYEILNLTTKKLALLTAKMRETEEHYDPTREFDFSLENIHQVESLFISCIEILILTGKPVIVSIGLKNACQMMYNAVSICISFASPKMVIASLKLFHTFYPVKCIRLDPNAGFYYNICWLTVHLFKSTSLDKDFCVCIEKSWDLLLKRFDLELQKAQKGEDTIDINGNFDAIIIVIGCLSKMSPIGTTNLVPDSIAKVLHKLLDLCHLKEQKLTDINVFELHSLFCDKISSSINHDSVWLTLMKRLYTKNYLEINSSSVHSFVIDSDIELLEDEANSSRKHETFLTNLCLQNTQIISSITSSKSLEEICRLHNMYTVEWETIATLRMVGHCLLNQGNFVQILKLANWICDTVVTNMMDEKMFKFILSLLITILKAIKDFAPTDVKDLEQKIQLVFLLPHVSETSPQEVLSSINREWTKKHLSSNEELNILSVHGLALVNSQTTSKFISSILITQLCRWKGDDYMFNQTLTFVLLKNDQLVNQVFAAIEDRDNMPFIARSIGLVTCFLSSADRNVSFSCKGPFERCHLTFQCNGCADWDSSHQKTSLSEDAECKIMDIFHELIKSQESNLLTTLGKWSASRVLRHCGFDRYFITSLFKLFSIEDKEVVEALRTVFLPLIIKPMSSGSSRVPKNEVFFSTFSKFFCTIRPEINYSIEITEIANITNLATHLAESKLIYVFAAFFCKLWSDTQLMKYIHGQVIAISSFRQIEPRTLFNRNKAEICTKIVHLIMDQILPESNLRESIFLLQEALVLFLDDRSELASLFTECLKYFVTAIILRANNHARSLLEIMVKETTDLNLDRVLETNTGRLPRQFVTRSLESIEKSLTFIKNIQDNRSLSSIFKGDFLYSMLLEYHRNPNVTSYVVYKIYISESVDRSRKTFIDSKFIQKLEDHLVPLIVSLNKFLLKQGDFYEDKKCAIESLGDILVILGPRTISIAKMNIMGILLTAFDKANGNNDVLKALLNVWQIFLNNCGPNDIGPHLSVICKDLIPYFDVDSRITASILGKIIIDNEEHLKDHFKELHFLPNLPCMKEIHDVLNKYLITKPPSDVVEAQDYLVENIRFFDELLDINNPDVKALHCQKLRQILTECKTALACLCVPNKEVSTDKMITLIIKKLLTNSQISDANLLTRIAECLGEIGAIDPGRLDLNLLSASQNVDGGLIEFDELPITLLSKLAYSLDSIDQSRIRDCGCYAIQETLKSYDVTENDQIWKKLPPDVQRDVKRFLTTKYVFVEREPVTSPVFKAEITYEEWVYRWSVALIEVIKRQTHKRAFEACLAFIKYNTTIARFVLPTIFWMALLDSDEDEIKSFIVGEIDAIYEQRPKDAQNCQLIFNDTLNPVTSLPRSDGQQNKSEFSKARLRCARTVFAIFDSIAQLKHRMFQNVKTSSKDEIEATSQMELLEKNLNKAELAELAFECQASARALLYLEEFIGSNRAALELSSTLASFQSYFLALDEPDGVEGISAIRESPPSLVDSIINHEANSELHYSLSCCEIAIKKDPDNIVYPQMLLRCLMNLDQQATALNYATGIMKRKKEWLEAIYPFAVEASWKLNSWDDLSGILKENQTIQCDSLGVSIGHLIDLIRKQDQINFNLMLKEMRKREMDPLSGCALEQGAYIRGYQHVLRLHMLTDVEMFSQFVFKHLNRPGCSTNYQENGMEIDLEIDLENDTENVRKNDQSLIDFQNLIRDWQRRNDLVQSSLRCQEQVFNLQRVLLSLKDVLPVQTSYERATFSLASAKLARKSQNLQRAYTHLVESKDLIKAAKLPIALAMHSEIEMAKFNWSKGDQESRERCYKGLKKALDKFQDISDSPGFDRGKLTKIKLLFSKFSEHLANLETDALIDKYKDIINDMRNLKSVSEEPYFCVARYMDSLMKAMELKNPKRPSLMMKVAKYYFTSLRFGSKHVYESMPRLLSIWFDLGSSNAEISKAKANETLRNDYTKYCNDLTEFMGKTRGSIPIHLFYTAFAQILSRICHSNLAISEVLMNILSSLLQEYPNQSMWMLMGVLMNGKNKVRAEKCSQIIRRAIAEIEKSVTGSKKLADLTHRMQYFAKLLIKLCHHEVPPNARSFHVNKVVPELNDRLTKGQLGKIMLPYQSSMSVRMNNKYESPGSFRPFPSDAVYILKFDPVGEVLSSQAKPKKVIIHCSDGKKYVVMCKPKDDLRKDARTMEFNNLINRLLKRDPETRKRRLHIRTYTVVPLDNDCGLIEWVNNTRSLKDSIDLARIFRHPKSPYPNVQYLAANVMHPKITKEGPEETRVKNFRDVMKLFSPPIMGDYYVQTFPDPTSWYMARVAFTRSAAVMSVVGYIIGLGDRHSENLLLDSSNGEVLHVDFNMLFNIGEKLEVPERVPFRLTHNMIAAMGVTGYEGAFRRTCEVTLKLMREKKEALMSVLQPFVYDPLCEWKKPQPRTRNSTARSGSTNDKETVETTNVLAVEYLDLIANRLKGSVKTTSSLSVSGQVQYLIDEATNETNLNRMYIGWCAFY